MQCDHMILEATAEANKGLCGRCKMAHDITQFESVKEDYRKNPPKTQAEVDAIAPLVGGDVSLRFFLISLLPIPAKLDPQNFSKMKFREVIRKAVQDVKPDGRKVCEEFLGLCDNVLFTSPKLSKGLSKLPRPYKKLMAVYQLWDMMQSDGIQSYYMNADQPVDQEVLKGLVYLGVSDACKFIKEGRSAFRLEAGIDEEIAEHLEHEIDQVLGDFEENLLGPELIKLQSGRNLNT